MKSMEQIPNGHCCRFFGVYSYSKITMTCNLHIGKLLKRLYKECETNVLLVTLRIDLCMFYCPSIPMDPVESNGRAKQLTFQMAVNQSLIIVLRRTLAGQLLILC